MLTLEDQKIQSLSNCLSTTAYRLADASLHLLLLKSQWSSSNGRRLIFERSCVRIPAPYTGWTFLNKKELRGYGFQHKHSTPSTSTCGQQDKSFFKFFFSGFSRPSLLGPDCFSTLSFQSRPKPSAQTIFLRTLSLKWLPSNQCAQIGRNFASFGYILKVFGHFLQDYLIFGQSLNQLWHFYAIGQIVIVVNGQILNNIIAIWSHCFQRSGLFIESHPTPTESKVLSYGKCSICYVLQMGFTN